MDKLCFCCAAYGGWGIVRVGTLVPESHMLFVCPFACGRHNSIGAMQHGYKDRVSYLFIDDRDIGLGNVEQQLIDSVEDVLASLRERPKVIMIYESCVMYLVGMDEQLVLDTLEKRYDDIIFKICRMNPISAETKNPPGLHMQKTMYSMMEDSGNLDEVNFIGNCVSVDINSEIYQVLRSLGIKKIHHISEKGTLQEFIDMGKSKYNLIIRPEGIQACDTRNFKFLPVSYDLDQVNNQYQQIFKMLGNNCDLSKYIDETRDVIKRAVKILGDSSISIGNSAVCRPYSTAMALKKYGFNVREIYINGVPEFEMDSYNWIRNECKEISVLNIHEPVLMERNNNSETDIGIGYIAGYYSKAKSVVNLMTDEGMFGYYGIRKLMEMLIDCFENPVELEKMILDYGLVV